MFVAISNIGVIWCWRLDACGLYFPLLQRALPICVLPVDNKSGNILSADMTSWEEYMDSEKVAIFAKSGDADFLRNCDFATALRQKNTSEFKDFRRRGRRFDDSLIDVFFVTVAGIFRNSPGCGLFPP